MKKLFLFFAAAGTMMFSSCEGPEGPAGQPGYSAESAVFEVNTTFTAGNNFSQTYLYPSNILPTDNVLIYELYAVEQNIDAWALLPQVYYFTGLGSAQYNYNFSYDQFTLLVDADFDRNLLPANFLQNKIFRVVVVPGMQWGRMSIDVSDYDAVVRSLGLEGKPVRRLN